MIASSIQGVPHLQAFETVIEAMFGGIDKTVVLMRIIDIVHPAALEPLSEELNVAGWRGWLLADTDEKKRALLKRAITLQKKAGTPFAIREAIRLLELPGILPGDGNIIVLEGVGLSYDGSFDYDGSQDYGGGFWANFSVRLNVDNTFDDSAENLLAIERVINEYKREACNLVEIIINEI